MDFPHDLGTPRWRTIRQPLAATALLIVMQAFAAAFDGTPPLDLLRPAGEEALRFAEPKSRLGGPANPCWPNAPIDNSGHVPQDVVAADFNQDGIPDLAIAFAFDDAIRLCIRSAFGAFVFQEEVEVGVHPGPLNDLPRALCAQDFDGDGFMDLAVLCSGNPSGPFRTSPSLGVLYGDPRGGFEPFVAIDMASSATPSPQFSTSLVAGLINGDNGVDLVVGHFDSHQFSVILNNGGRSWSAPSVFRVVTAGDGPVGLSLADLDFNGTTDLVVANRRDLQLWRGNGNGTFTHGATFATGTAFTAVGAADFDQDGVWDLVALDGTESRMYVYMGLNIAGTVRRLWSAQLSPGAGPIDLLVYDANLDGRDDVALIYLLAGGGDIFLGQGNTSTAPLALCQHFSTAQSPRAIANADFNRDGRDDLAVVHEGDQTKPDNDDLVLIFNSLPTYGAPNLQPQVSWVPGRQISPYLDRPTGLVWDPTRTSLWTVDRRQRQIVRLTSNGQTQWTFSLTAADPTRFHDPVNIAVDGRGRLWISDRLAGRVFEFDPARIFNPVTSDFPTAPAGLSHPRAIAFDQLAGRLLISDECEPRILAFTTRGTLLQSYTVAGGHRIADMDFAGNSQTLWATLLDSPGQLVQLVLNEGSRQATIAATRSGENFAAVLSGTRLTSLACDSQTNRLWLVTDNGALVLATSIPPYSVQMIRELRLLREIHSADINTSGQVLLADAGLLGTLAALDKNGTIVETLALNGFNSPPRTVEGICCRGNRIFVLDGLNNEIRVLDPVGNPQGLIRTPALAGRRPRGLYTTGVSSPFFVGTQGRVLELAANGSLIAEHIIPASTSPGSISRGDEPTDLMLFVPSRGSLLFFGSDFALRNVLFQSQPLLPGFQSQAAVVRGTLQRSYVLVGSGQPTVVTSQPISPFLTSARHWRRYN